MITKVSPTSASPARRVFELKPIMRPKTGLHHTQVRKARSALSVCKQLLGG
jgi:hypothetical protein